MPDADCIQIKSVFIVMGTMNVLTDFALLLVPIPQLWALQIRKDTKLELIGIFSIGSLCVILFPRQNRSISLADFAPFANSVTVVSVYRIPKLNSFSALDAGWSDIDASIWSLVEISVALVAASAITYRPLYNFVFRISWSSFSGPKARTASSNTTRSPYPNGSQVRSASTKGGDVSLQALNSTSGHDKARLSEHGDAFLRTEDSIDM